MRRRRMRNLLFLLLVGFLLSGMFTIAVHTLNVAAAELETREALTVSFVNQYAEVDTELTVETNAVDPVMYLWYVGGKQIDNATASYTPTTADLEKWIEVEITSGDETASAKMYFSKLPVVYIETENRQEITSKETYIDATITVQGNSQYSDTGVLYDGATEIRGRGNSTWSQPKKPYRMKFGKKANMFGMGKSKHWVLLANYLDESLMRNTLAYDLSGSMGMEQMSTVWVDVIMNGEYAGNYQFCENIRIDDTRVDIFDWEGFAEESAEKIAEAEGMDEDTTDDLIEYMAEKNMQWITSGSVEFNNNRYDLSDYSNIEVPSINGGYLLELDEYYDEVSKFKTNSSQPIMFKNPEFVKTNSDMMKFVQDYVQAFEDAVQSSDYKAVYDGEAIHYSELYDFDALVDYWLISEIFYNEELNKKSTYMYKDIDGLMMMGPIWDMDWSSGAAGTAAGATNQWATNSFNANAQKDQWYKNLVQDPYFLVRAQERYWEIRDEQVQDMLDVMDEHYEYLEESGKADYETWLSKAGRRTSFESDYHNLKTWLNTHLAWMDSQMATEDSFDSSFLQKNNSLSLTLTNIDGTAFEADTTEVAPADVIGPNGKTVKLQVSGLDGTAKIFVNGCEYQEMDVVKDGTNVDIEAVVLNAEVGEKNVIEVKVYDDSNNIMATNYVTLKTFEVEEETTPVDEIFTDVKESEWFFDSVQYVYDAEIMQGTSKTTFKPYENVLRATVVETLYKLEKKPDIDSFPNFSQLKDFQENEWWAKSVEWAMANGIATGDTSAHKFYAQKKVSREEIATFIYRYAKDYKGLELTLSRDTDEILQGVDVSDWAKEAFAWAIDNEIISGFESVNGSGRTVYDLAPKKGADRAQLATILQRFLTKYPTE